MSAAEFAAFREPGYAKAAFNMHAEPRPGGGTLLTTETRIQATDEHARRSFRRYWRVIHSGQRRDPPRLAARDPAAGRAR